MRKEKNFSWIINTYIKQQFSPRRLPGLISSSLKSQICVGTCSMVLNSPSICMLFTNMKLYDEQQIQRQNTIISAMLGRANVEKQKNQKNKENIINIVSISRNCVNNAKLNQTTKKTERIKTEEVQAKQIMQLKTSISKKLDKTKILNIIEHINANYKIFNILEYRLKDITSFVNALNQSIIKVHSMNSNSNKKCLQSTVCELEKLCEKIIKIIGIVKISLQESGSIVQQYEQNNQKEPYFNQTSRQYTQTNQNRPYYNLKTYAKQINEKLKQIQAKYTALSKELLARNIKYRQNKNCYSNGFNININFTDHFNLDSQSLDEQDDNYLCVPNDTVKLFEKYGLKYSLNHSQRSILKTSGNNVLGKLTAAKNRSKNKRISIQLLALENARKGDDYNHKSRFMHRDGINIGSGRTFEKHGMFNNFKRKFRKQVKIGTQQEDEQSQTQEKSQTIRRGLRKNKTISKNQNQLSANSSLKKPFDFVNDQQSSKSIDARRKRRANTYQDRPKSRSKTSISSNQSSRRGSTKSNSKNRKIISRKGSTSYRSRSLSNKSNKKPKSFKNKAKIQVSRSLKKLIEDALDFKKLGKKYVARSGKIIPLEDLEELGVSTKQIEIQKKFQIFHKRNPKKQKSKILNKDKAKAQKQKNGLSGLLTEELKQKKYEHNKKTKRKNSKMHQYKSTRRLGVTLGNQRDHIKMSEEQMTKQQDLNKKKSPSQVTSHGGSKRFNISNSRIKYEEQEEDGKSKIPKKVHAYKQNYDQFSPAPTQFKVNIQEKQTFTEQYVKFYPHIQCTFYKTTKKYMKSQDYLNSNIGREENKIIQFAPIPNFSVKKYVNQGNKNEMNQLMIKKRLFDQQNKKLNFSKRLITAMNQLQQKQLIEWGNSKTIDNYHNPYTPENRVNFIETDYNTIRSVF